jgi:hypothetical protein
VSTSAGPTSTTRPQPAGEDPRPEPRARPRERKCDDVHQMVEMGSTDIDELRALCERWEHATEATATLRRSPLTRTVKIPTGSRSSPSSTPTRHDGELPTPRDHRPG